MEKLKLHTPDLTVQNIEKLAALFPNCVTETRDEKGHLKHAIDFDPLRQELSDRAVFRDSSYESDSTKINVEQIFKLLSPETEVKSL